MADTSSDDIHGLRIEEWTHHIGGHPIFVITGSPRIDGSQMARLMKELNEAGGWQNRRNTSRDAPSGFAFKMRSGAKSFLRVLVSVIQQDAAGRKPPSLHTDTTQ